MSGAFSTAKPACSTCALCSALIVADARRAPCRPSFRLSLICAVCDRSSSVRASTGSRDVEVDAADQVGGVLLLREPARRGARSRRAPTARTPTSRARRGSRKASAWIETNRSACTAPRLLHARVRAARSSRRRASASRACWARRRSCASACCAIASIDVLLVRAAPADRARILAAVARVERDGDAARRARLRAAASRRAFAAACGAGGRSTRSRAAFAALLEQRHQRIERRQRIEVEHQRDARIRPPARARTAAA